MDTNVLYYGDKLNILRSWMHPMRADKGAPDVRRAGNAEDDPPGSS